MKRLLLLFSMVSCWTLGYAQQTYTFGTGGATGQSGPSQTDINTAYTGTTLDGQVTVNGGIQYWVVPQSGVYGIQAFGAQGYGPFGGRGAHITGEFILTAGDTLKILVGQKGAPPVGSGTNQHGGGGGTFVTYTDNTPLVVAGGGGGSWASAFNDTTDGSALTRGRNGINGPAGNGAGGVNGNGGTSASNAGAGGGLLTNGNTTTMASGLAYVNGGTGGKAASSGGEGGFGGGGGASSWDNRRCGGGGGYSGGGGSASNSSSSGFPEGGGGGSFNSGNNPVNLGGINLGDGQVVIAPLSFGAPYDVGVISIDDPSNFCAGTHSVTATFQNFGTTQLTSVSINWSVNGVAQTPYSWTGTLDTIGGAGATSAQVTLGSYTFASSTPYNFSVWSSSPNGQTDTINANDTINKVLQTGLMPPTAFAASNVMTTSADLSWNGGGATNFRVTYGQAGFNPQSAGTTVPVAANMVSITTLSANTTYEAYIVATCPTGSVYSDTTGPISFRTPCTISTAPFSESFDDPVNWISRNTIDACWSASPSAGSTWSWEPRSTGPTSGNGPLQDLTGNNFMYCEASISGTYPDAELISPPIDVSGLTTPGLYFFQHRYSGATIADMDIEVSNDFGTTWSNVYNITGDLQTSSGDPWELEFVNLVAYTGDTIMVKFKQHFNGCCGDAAIDSVVVDEAPTCPWPTSFAMTGRTDSSVTVTWNDPTGSNWELKWGPPGFTQASPGAGTKTTAYNPDTIQGLQSNTEYEVYVRTDCGPNGTSIWIGPITVRTSCSPFAAPYSDNYDNSPSDVVPYCWANYITGGRTTNGVAQTYQFGTPFSSPNHIRFYNGSPAGPGDTTLLISPKFSDLTAGDKRIKFMANGTTTAGNSLIVGTMGDPMDALSFNALDTIQLGSTYQLYVANLDAAAGYNGTDEYVAFRHGNTATFRTIYIDDFVYEVTPACVPPLITTLGVAGVSPTSATIYWGAGSDGNETHWEVGPVGFTPGTGTYTSTDSVAGGIDTTVAGGLTAQTTYEFYVRDSCASNGFSPWVGPFSFTTACNIFTAPLSEDFDGTSWVASGSNAGNSVDPCWTVSPDPTSSAVFKWIPRSTGPTSGNGPLNDKTGTNFLYCEASGAATTDVAYLYSPIVDVSALTLPAIYFSQHRYSNATIADMDVEVTNDFGATWVNVYSVTGDIQTSSSDPWDDQIIPLTAFVGDTIQVRFVQLSNGCCGDAAIDDVEIKEAPSCPDVNNLAAGGVTDSSATLSWVGNPNTGSYEIWFGPQGFFQGTATVGGAKSIQTTSSLLVDTLTDNTCYEFLVRGICAPGDTGNWVGPVSFCTPCLSFNAPYWETFDIWPLSCWDMNGGQWNWNDFAGPGTDHYAEANFWGQSSGEAWMTSPVINLNSNNAVIEFDWSHLYSTSYPDDQLLVMVNIVGTSTWDTIVDFKGPTNFNDPTAGNSNTPGNFITETVALNNATYANTSIRVRFIGVTDFGPDCFVNDFKVRYPVSDDLELLGAEFSKKSKCLNNADTAIFHVQNILGSTVNFATDPLTVHYVVTGPINTTSSVTVSTGTLPLLDTISIMATNIDLSAPGNYSMNAWIDPNSTNLDGLNDTLLASVNITIYDDWVVTPDTVVVINNMTDTVILEAKSPYLSGGTFLFTEIRHFNATGAGTVPSYLTADDYIEITGVPGSDLDGITLEVWTGTSAVINYTFPPGTLIGPNGTAIIMQGQGAGASQPANFMYDGRGTYTGTFGSGSIAGYVLKDGTTVLDAVTYNSYTFPAASGVTSADWTGNSGSPSGTAGIRLIGPDINSATNWTVVSTTTTQDAQVLNANVPLPAAAATAGFDWKLNGVVIDTLPQTVVGPYSSSGVYNYVATFNGPCGLQSDTVVVIVNLPGSCPIPTNLAGTAPACDSIVVTWNSAADSALVAYVPSGGTAGVGNLVVGDSSYAATGLTPSTNYDFYVANICGSDTSAYAGPYTINSGTAGAPVASFTGVPAGAGSLTYNFDASGSTGNGNTYTWDYGDGNTGSGVTSSNTYATGGSYTVKVVVSNACGSDSITVTFADVSLGESLLSQNLKLYPNPATEVLNVELSIEGASEVSVRILDMSGKQVIAVSKDKKDKLMTESIDISSLAKGVYMIEVSAGEATTVRRLVKE